jgi:glutamyl-tRNA reductase
VEQFSQALLNKFLHEPTRALKAAAEEGRSYGLLVALRRLFGLEKNDGGAGGAGGAGRDAPE